QGQSKAIETVFEAIHEGKPDAELLAYQYLQMLPQIARGDSNKLWIVPSELGEALKGIGGVLGRLQPEPDGPAPSDGAAAPSPDDLPFEAPVLQDPNEALAQARREAA